MNNDMKNIYEIIGNLYIKQQAAEQDRKFWFDAYTAVQEKVKNAETENTQLKADLEKVTAELEQLKAEHEQLLDNMLKPTEGACES